MIPSSHLLNVDIIPVQQGKPSVVLRRLELSIPHTGIGVALDPCESHRDNGTTVSYVEAKDKGSANRWESTVGIAATRDIINSNE